MGDGAGLRGKEVMVGEVEAVSESWDFAVAGYQTSRGGEGEDCTPPAASKRMQDDRFTSYAVQGLRKTLGHFVSASWRTEWRFESRRQKTRQTGAKASAVVVTLPPP